jgi:hypothetical protein
MTVIDYNLFLIFLIDKISLYGIFKRKMDFYFLFYFKAPLNFLFIFFYSMFILFEINMNNLFILFYFFFIDDHK